ncbi:N-acetylmuramoyl-L-alanine amidase-like domain-containing protein [Oleiharenicola lentus]|uniref:N-acetylmuramoyl-L-alanine amidase-like domain-containing protein n=1 Tax=Oleiharenicola lentus TaxID=2508720 RepID=UPI003F67B5F3
MKTFLLFAALATAALAASPAPSPDLAALQAKPLYQFNESEVGTYLSHLQLTEPELRARIIHLARKNLKQPYELYLLGEAPFETYDPQPLYSLTKSDCLVFTEHTYAMALSRDWSGFMRLLQRIRYREGRIGVVTRNHFTETDWNPSNRWLVRDITTEIGGDKMRRFDQKIDRSKFLLGRYKLTTPIPVELHRETYVPYADVDLAKAHLTDGDCIEIVRGIVKPGMPDNEIFGGSAWIGHVGLAARGPAGELHLIHSIAPEVREETIEQFIARETAHNAEKDAAGKPRLLGFKFLRLEADPLAKLRQLDGLDAPRVTLPSGAVLP